MGPKSQPSSPRRSSSSSRASTWPGASTRTGSRAARSTRADAMTSYTPDPGHLGPSARRQSATADGTLARQARYSRWDGTQSVVDLEADEIIDALAEDVMAEGDIGEALRRLIERGWRGSDPTRQDLAGLNDLLERLQRRRDELLDRYQLGDVLGDIRAELEDIVAEERAGIEHRLEAATGSRETG